MKKRVSIILSIVLFASICITGHGIAESEEKIEPLRYMYIHSIVAYLSVDNGVATCNGAGDSTEPSTTTTIKVTLQRRVIGTSGWSSVCTWTDTKSGRMMAYVDETANVARGYDYRVYTYCIIKDSNGDILESRGHYSSIESYPF